MINIAYYQQAWPPRLPDAAHPDYWDELFRLNVQDVIRRHIGTGVQPFSLVSRIVLDE